MQCMQFITCLGFSPGQELLQCCHKLIFGFQEVYHHMAGVIINKGSYIARSLNVFGLHWLTKAIVAYFQVLTNSLERARKGFESELAKLQPWPICGVG